MSGVGKRFPADLELLTTISDQLADSIVRAAHRKYLSTGSPDAQGFLQELSRSVRENLSVAHYDHDEVRKRFGATCAEVVQRPNWDVKRLARELGVDPKSVDNWIDGRTASIKLDKVVLLAQIAEKDIGWLVALEPADLGTEISSKLDRLASDLESLRTFSERAFSTLGDDLALLREGDNARAAR
ncbi:MAG: hypothetical protein ACRD4E_10750 [Bryobacteraceae bacterium]